MSGALSLLTKGMGVARGAVQSATALANLFNSGIGSQGFGATLTLGGFAFQDMELPEEIACGGKQQHEIHRFPGGGRRIDVMGPDEDDITWSGVFFSADATDREQQVSEMRRNGAVVPLAWGPVVVPVLITAFNVRWRDAGHYIPYTIVCSPQSPRQATIRDEDDEANDLSDMDDANPLAGVTGALSDAANAVGDVVSDVADAAGQALSIANGAFAAVSGVIGPITQALGIQVPFLSQASVMLELSKYAVSGLTTMGASMVSVDLLGQMQGANLAMIDDRMFNAGSADASPDALNAAAADARDAAIGTRSQAAVGSADVAQQANSVRGVGIPLPPMPPGRIPAVPPSSLPGYSDRVFGTGTPYSSAADLQNYTQTLRLVDLNTLRAGGMSEPQILGAYNNAGRPDLYAPPL